MFSLSYAVTAGLVVLALLIGYWLGSRRNADIKTVKENLAACDINLKANKDKVIKLENNLKDERVTSEQRAKEADQARRDYGEKTAEVKRLQDELKNGSEDGDVVKNLRAELDRQIIASDQAAGELAKQQGENEKLQKNMKPLQDQLARATEKLQSTEVADVQKLQNQLDVFNERWKVTSKSWQKTILSKVKRAKQAD